MRMMTLVAAAICTLAAAAPAHSKNLVTNGNFKTPDKGYPVGAIATWTPPIAGSTATPPSAAANWVMLVSNSVSPGGSVTTQIVDSTFPGAPAGTKMLHVTVSNNAFGSGVINYLKNPLSGFYFTCAWIYINQGAVGIGSGDEAYTDVAEVLDRQHSWEVMNVRGQNGGTPTVTDLMLVYAMPSINDAVAFTDFYVQGASLSTSQAQCKPY
jgi:hypothetical protein